MLPAQLPPDLGYRPPLDGLRGLAVALMVAVHATYPLVPEWGAFMRGGFLGVDIFFVLSGFLITTLLLEEHQRTGRVSLPAFYRRRARRLLPAVAVLLAAHALLAAVSGADLGLEARTAGAVGLQGINWVIGGGGDVAAGLGHLWSLSVEEQFYLLWPLLLLVAMRRRRPTAALALIAGAGMAWATGVRVWLWLKGAGWETIHVRTDDGSTSCSWASCSPSPSDGAGRSGARGAMGSGALAVLLVCVATVHKDSGWLYAGGGFTVISLAAVALVASLLDAGSPLVADLRMVDSFHRSG